MAPSNISPGSAATVLSFLALAGLQLETRFRVGEVLAAPRPELSDEPEQPTLGPRLLMVLVLHELRPTVLRHLIVPA